MHIDSALHRSHQAVRDQQRVDRMLADQARVGTFLGEHPFARRVLGKQAEKFIKASSVVVPTEVKKPVAVRPDTEVAIQNFHASSPTISVVSELLRPKPELAQDIPMPMDTGHPNGEPAGAGQGAARLVTSSR